MPQYLLHEVRELLTLGHIVAVVEWSNYGMYDVQKRQLGELLGNRLICLQDTNKMDALERVIQEFVPNVVHLQEVPELWLNYQDAVRLYNKNRTYKLIETSHDSGFDVGRKVFMPDGFGFINNFHVDKYKHFNIPYKIIEYPIIVKSRPDRTMALDALGLDSAKKHILNVGLFTPRKNQAEIFEVARKLTDYPVEFHFVGNQADNFKSYWKPLLTNKPSNCTLWGEQSDVDKFYSAMDLFYFASQGTKEDRETNPLVLKEALGWQMPVLMYNLDVYCGAYDAEPLVKFIESNIDKTVRLLLSNLGLDCGLTEDMFRFSFVPIENKINIHYDGPSEKDVKVVIRDIDTLLSIWAFDAHLAHGVQYWVIPLQEHKLNLASCKTFNGFRIEFYSLEKELLLTHELRMRSGVSICNVNFSTDPFDLPFYPFVEFFHCGLYADVEFAPGGLVIDIGANGGVFTAYALYRGAGNVISVEPQAMALKNLYGTFGHDRRVTIVPYAVASEAGKRVMYAIDGNTTMSSFTPGRLDSEYINHTRYTIEVETISFDYLLQLPIDGRRIKRVDLLKLDIEEAEYEVIDAIPLSELALVQNIIIEFHANKQRLIGLLNKLTEAGFVYELRDQDTQLPTDVDAYTGCVIARRTT